MALHHQPIRISDAFMTLSSVFAEMEHKNNTMIAYYIYPKEVPSQIAAFLPRMEILMNRVRELEALVIPHLEMLLDDAEIWIAVKLIPSLEQLLKSINLFQALFAEHYDRMLQLRQPYLPMFQRLSIVVQRLHHFRAFHSGDQHRPRAEALLPPPSTDVPMYCSAAVAFVNNMDAGRVTTCLPSDLTAENKATLRAEGGDFMWWECSRCAFRLRYHVTTSRASNITSTTEIRSHEDVNGIEYRSAWLAKCHLYHPGRARQQQERQRRRTGESRSAAVPVNTYGVGGVKYGCPFCFAMGSSFIPDITAFSRAKDFMRHLKAAHRDVLPTGLLLVQLGAVSNGVLPRELPRWDLNFL